LGIWGYFFCCHSTAQHSRKHPYTALGHMLGFVCIYGPPTGNHYISVDNFSIFLKNMHKCYCLHCCLFPSRTSLFCFFSNVIILHRILWSAILKLDFYPPHILFTVIVEYLKLIRLDMMHFILKPNNSHRKTSISYKVDMVSLCQVAGIKSVTTEMISFQQSFHAYISLLLNGISCL
jgi:hypothetical protein